MSFWGELKRRNVFKVGAAYVIVAWLIVQVANTFFPILHLPDWAVTLIACFLILGLPVALILAWAYEMTPEGVKLTKKVPLAESITHVTGRKLNFMLGGLLVIAVALLVFDNFYLDRQVVEPEEASTLSEETPANVNVEEAEKSIAVLPFDDLSPEKDQEYFVLGLSEEILNSLAQVEYLTVIAKTSSFSFKDTNKTIQEIAGILGVENILEGSVRKAGNALRITAQLINAVDGSHLWSKTYDKEFTKVEEMFSVQENIATAVTDELKVTLGIKSIQRTIGGTENLEAYELYLVTLGQENNGDYNLALESIDSAISIDPKFALAWNLKAQIHIDLVIFGAGNQAVTEKDAALNAAQSAIECDPKLGAAYTTLGFIKTQKGDWLEAESAYRKAFELSDRILAGLSLANVEAPIHYTAVGHFKRTLELVEAARKNDPLNQIISTWYFFILGLLDDMQRAEEEYERCRGLPGVNSGGMVYDMISRLRLGTGNVVSGDEIVSSNPIHEVVKKHLDSPGKGLVELRQIYIDNDNLSSDDFYEIALGAAYFGDNEFAMDAMERAAGLESSGIFELWLPVYSQVRQMPRFKEFVREIGLVDYWEQFGYPDLCKPTDDSDFVCD